MFKYKGIIFFITTLILVSSSIVFILFNDNFRRNLFNKFFSGYGLYQTFKMSKNVYDRDFVSAEKQILSYINISQKISKGKNSMLKGIFQVTELISSKAYTQKDFNDMQEVYIEINEITDDIYQNHIWLARALLDDDLDKSIFHFKKAIKLARSDENVYREIVNILYNNKKGAELINAYCKNYFKDYGGGITKNDGFLYDEIKFFYGSSSEFAISINDNNLLYSNFIGDVGKYNNYNVSLEKNKSVNQISIYKNFFSGSIITINNLVLSNDNEEFKINLDDVIAHSLFSYIYDQSKNEIIIFNTSDKSDIIKINFLKNYKNISNISFNLKLVRLPIISNNICLNLDEN